MDFINALIWLAAGAMIGWFANRIVTFQMARRSGKLVLPFVDLSNEDKNLDRKAAPILSPLSAPPEYESLKEQFFPNDSLGG